MLYYGIYYAAVVAASTDVYLLVTYLPTVHINIFSAVGRRTVSGIAIYYVRYSGVEVCWMGVATIVNICISKMSTFIFIYLQNGSYLINITV